MSQPSKRTDAETTPLGTPEEAAGVEDATPADGSDRAVAQSPEGHVSDGLRHDDPFRLGWHTLSSDLIQKYAAQPLPRPDEEDLTNTVPPGGALRAASDGDALPAAPPSEPIELPLVPRKRWLIFLLVGCALAAAVGWLALRGDKSSGDVAERAETPRVGAPQTATKPKDEKAEPSVVPAPAVPAKEPLAPSHAQEANPPSAAQDATSAIAERSSTPVKAASEATQQRPARAARPTPKPAAPTSAAKPSQRPQDLFPPLD